MKNLEDLKLSLKKLNLKKDDLLINDQIKVNELMVIGPNGEQLGTKALKDALTLASYAGLDLVLMNPGNERPVGKIMDYNKHKYEKQKRAKEALKTQRANNKDMKEYQLSVTIDIGDFNTRKKNAENYLLEFKHEESEELPEEIKALVEERKQARAEKNWAKSDEIRDRIISLGYSIKDTKDGIIVKKEN